MSPCRGLPSPDGEPGPARLPVDQVERLARFEAANPEVIIERPDYRRGQQWWHARIEGRKIASDTELRALLDYLERLLGEEDGQ